MLFLPREMVWRWLTLGGEGSGAWFGIHVPTSGPVNLSFKSHPPWRIQNLDPGSWSVGDFPGQLLLPRACHRKVCVCVKKEMKGAATAYWVEKDVTRSSVFQNAEMLGRGFALSQKARQAPAY